MMIRRLALVLLFASTACVSRSPGRLYPSSTEPLSDEQAALRQELEEDVRGLSIEIGSRNAARDLSSVHAAEAWIIEQLERAGIAAARDEVDMNGLKAANVEAIFQGSTIPEETIVIGAHYDTAAGSPGANDNASGVALLLATARRLVGRSLDRTVRIVFFVNEESPFSGGIQMGSRVYAGRCRARGDRIVLMIAVDSVGYYSRERGSQDRPFLAAGAVPGTANFVAFASDREHAPLLDRVLHTFQSVSRFPSIGLSSNSKALYRSDHAAFLWEGYPAIMMSDTSAGRDPHYHLPSDVADNLAYDDMARLSEGFIELVRSLSMDSTTLSELVDSDATGALPDLRVDDSNVSQLDEIAAVRD